MVIWAYFILDNVHKYVDFELTLKIIIFTQSNSDFLWNTDKGWKTAITLDSVWTLQSNCDCVWVAPASHGSLFALSRCWRHFATATVTTQGPGADTVLHRGALSSDWAWELPNCFMENRMFSLSGDNQHKSRESSPRARSNEETLGVQVDSARC